MKLISTARLVALTFCSFLNQVLMERLLYANVGLTKWLYPIAMTAVLSTATTSTNEGASSTAMNDALTRFIREKQIDSFQKVSFLLFLYRHATHHEVSHEFARQLNFSGDPILEEVVNELSASGLLHQRSGRYILDTKPEISEGLANLVEAYEDPVARQSLLSQLYQRQEVYA